MQSIGANEIGERIKQVREREQLNQRDFGARLGTSSGRISEIESGKTMPGGEFWLKLNQEFGADITYILTGKQQRQLAAESVAKVNAYAAASQQQLRREKLQAMKLDSATEIAEEDLMSYWRACRMDDRAMLIQLAKRLSAKAHL